MKLKVLRSGSSANGYVLCNDTEALVIEAGAPVNEVLEAVSYSPSRIVGLLVTHEHGDHCKHYRKYLAYGMKMYCSPGTASRLERLPHNIVEVRKLSPFQLGGFKVTPFDTEHDSVEPYGYLIEHSEFGKLLFVTDSFFIKYKFSGLNHIMIECNYDEKILSDNVDKGVIPPCVAARTRTSHMSIDMCEMTLKSNDLSSVSEIVLLHLSGNNSHEAEFAKRIEGATGIPAYIAKKGLVIELGKV